MALGQLDFACFLTQNCPLFRSRANRRLVSACELRPACSEKRQDNEHKEALKNQIQKSPRSQTQRVMLLTSIFLPRVRTPCGHGAQVIVEGREEKTDGGERNEDPKNQPKTKHPSPQADSTIL